MRKAIELAQIGVSLQELPTCNPERAKLAGENNEFPLWTGLPKLLLSPKRMRKARIVAFERSDPSHVAFDILRTRLRRSLKHNGWSSVAVTSPAANSGKTVVGLNLAFSLARQRECRTVLVDLDLRRPRVSEMLGIKDGKSIEHFLSGTHPLEEIFRSYGGNLAIACGRGPVSGSAEILHSLNTAKSIGEIKIKLSPDVIIYDLPPMLLSDDVMAFLPNVDCVLVVASAELTTRDQIERCIRELSEQTNVVGVVLNKCRYFSERPGYY